MEIRYLGIDIGGTNIKSVILNESGEVIEQSIAPTEDSGKSPGKWKQYISKLIQNKTDSLAKGNKDLMRCTVSAPGLADEQNRKIIANMLVNGCAQLNYSENMKMFAITQTFIGQSERFV